ncbi:MAG: type II toxin-antitoxin system PemK/MazF family toxin [Gammaproteobacteria bacterium]|nr:type II toxin-antitoxin system PemK/MazF family toxin [Gammaproteobacteria bacterium]
MYIPDKGDIVWLNFEPSAGREITKRRPAFVISRKAFNEHTGFAIMAPITSTVRGIKLEVELKGVETEGAILIYQMKSLDFENRDIELIEKAPPATTNKVTELAQIITK